MKYKNGKRRSPAGGKCSKCKEPIQEKPKTYELEHESIKEGRSVILPVETMIWFCECGGEYEDGFGLKLHEAKCEHEGYISPQRIGKLREEFGRLAGRTYAKGEDKQLTQKEFAKLIGVGETTVVRWEAGEFFPTGAHEKLLKFIEHPKIQKKFWQKNCESQEGTEVASVKEEFPTEPIEKWLGENASIPFNLHPGLNSAGPDQVIAYA